MARLRNNLRLAAILLSSAVCAFSQSVPAPHLTTRDAPDNKPSFAQRDQQIRAVPEGEVTLDVVIPQRAGLSAQPLTAKDFAIYDNGTPVLDFRLAEPDAAGGDNSAKVLFVIDALSMDPIDIEHAKQEIGAYLKRDGGRLRYPVSIVSLEKNIGKAERAHAAMVKPLGGHSGFLRLIPYGLDGNAQNAALQKANIFSAPLLDIQGGEGGAVRMSLSLEALSLIGDAESSVPGHKLLIWISPGWPVPSSGSVRDQISLQGEVAYLSTVMEQGRITLYNVNPAPQGFNAPANPGINNAASPNVSMAGPEAGPAGNGATQSAAGTGRSLTFGDISLQALARNSGGLVFTSGGEVRAEITQCIADAGRFASLSYTPSTAHKPNTFHSVVVTLDGSAGKARTMAGFYAQPVVSAASDTAPAQGSQARTR